MDHTTAEKNAHTLLAALEVEHSVLARRSPPGPPIQDILIKYTP
jgi:hypothetical protein